MESLAIWMGLLLPSQASSEAMPEGPEASFRSLLGNN